jgi:alpha-tubulin suppressor-like RCC1 family protein
LKIPSIARVASATTLCLAVACGDQGTGPSERPAEPERLDVHWVSVALMSGWVYSSCGLTDDGIAYCWGENFGFTNGHPLLEEGPYDGSVNEPIPVDGGIAFKQITAGYRHTCGLSQAGEAYCWGSTGQQGYPSNAWTPQLIPGGLTFDLLSAGRNSTCGLLEDGTAYCWTGHENQPVPVPGGLTFKTLGGGASLGTCGISSEGDLYCWTIPIWSEQNQWTDEPVQLSEGLGLEVLAEHGSCALDQVGSVHCWRADGSHYLKEHPGLSFQSLSGPCGIAVGGAAYCLLSIPTDPTPVSSVPIPGGITFATLSYGNEHMCGTTPDGRAFCLGCNAYGQLGDGTDPVSGFECGANFLTSSAPVLVKNPRK